LSKCVRRATRRVTLKSRDKKNLNYVIFLALHISSTLLEKYQGKDVCYA